MAAMREKVAIWRLLLPALVLILGIATGTSIVVQVKAQMNEVNPRFVFVHGMGHGAWCFAQLITLLQEAGYTATAVDLTSHGINKAVADDVTTVAQYIQPLVTLFDTVIQEKAIVVGHSLGGGPISVIAEMFPEKVEKAVFLAAIYPTDKNTFFSAMPSSVLTRLVGEGDLMPQGDPPTSVKLNVARITKFFYNKSPKSDANLASALVVNTPYRPGQEPINLTANNYGPTRKFYIHTGRDEAITMEEQLEMIAANPWKPEKSFNLPTADHAVFFSQKKALSRILLEIATTP